MTTPLYRQAGDKPQPQLPGTYEEALWAQYNYCLAAFNSTESESFSMPGVPSTFKSHPGFLRFDGQVKVLRNMIWPEWEDDDYRKDLAPAVSTRKVDEFGEDCRHQEDEADSYSDDDCNCKERKFTVEKDSFEVFRAITLLFHRRNIFPTGDKASLLP